MDKLTHLLDTHPVILGDGAMGTMLQAAGLDTGGAPEEWNVSRPEVIRGIYQAYVDAGSQVITTNTFGGTSYRLGRDNLAAHVREFNVAGARLAREVADAADHPVLVAGDVGPTGEIFAPLGTLPPEDAQAAFAEQAAALVEGGVDFFLIETMSALEEVEAAVRGIRSVSDLPIAATMTFDTHFRTMMGVKPVQAVKALHDAGCAGHRRELRQRPGRDRADHRRDGRGQAGRRLPGRPIQRRPAQVCRGGDPLRRHAGGHGRVRAEDEGAGRQLHRRMLRLDAGAHRGDERGVGRLIVSRLRRERVCDPTSCAANRQRRISAEHRMRTPFPGMDPYLEQPESWQGFHNSLIAALALDLAPRLRPRYYVATEERTYLYAPDRSTFIGRPDLNVIAPVFQESRADLVRQAGGRRRAGRTPDP